MPTLNSITTILIVVLFALFSASTYFAFHFYGEKELKQLEKQKVEDTLASANKEIDLYRQSIQKERDLLVESEKKRLDLREEFNELLEKYDRDETPKEHKPIIVSCSIPPPNFMLLKQAYCKSGDKSDWCTRSTTN